ncbi:MAG: type II toxin-antitoxin system HicB family antitoxin [Methanosarcinales archaeon]|nr:type II toxin-antitoxin system HicB family antitoxin [Methanosarcinales archaeon]
MKFNIICEIDEEGIYVVECPDLPGCLSEGDTFDEAMDNINEAIIGCLTSRLKTAKEKLLKNRASSFKKRMSLSLDTTMTAEYA